MRFKLFIFLIFTQITSFAQGVNNLWLMGYESWAGPPYYGGVNMNFTSTSLNITYESRAYNVNCTNGVICDKSGQLLFCSNGIYIANAQFDTMQNGAGLNPAYFTSTKDSGGLTIPQANLIIPFPDDSTKYYLFHETCDDYNRSYCTLFLYYSVVDMNQDSGKGAVIDKNHWLLNDSLVSGRLTACKHANGRDWWLIAHQYNTDLYYKYLITPAGIQGPFSQSIGVKRDTYFGQCTFSPDGKYFSYYEPYVGDLDIFDFDRCSGDFVTKAHVDINDSANSGGTAFSPNSQVLYVSSMNYVYQFDLASSDIPSSKKTVAIYDGYYSPVYPFASIFYLSQLAPDGKIYINCTNGTLDMHVINNPDSLGLACDVCQHCVHLPAFNALTIPNHPNYFLGPDRGTICDSLHIGIDEIANNENSINVFPNPVTAREQVTFTFPSIGDNRSISIYNIEGKEIFRYSVPQWSSIQHIKLPELFKGIYIARLLTDSNKQLADVKFIVE